MSEHGHVVEAERKTPLWGEYDLAVLGGGPAGMAAASSAARLGLKTILIEHYGFLGGMGTAAGVTNFCGLHALIHGRIERVVQGFATELLEHIDALGGLNAPHMLFGGRIAAQAYDNAAYKIAADRITRKAGVEAKVSAEAQVVIRVGIRDVTCAGTGTPRTIGSLACFPRNRLLSRRSFVLSEVVPRVRKPSVPALRPLSGQGGSCG